MKLGFVSLLIFQGVAGDTLKRELLTVDLSGITSNERFQTCLGCFDKIDESRSCLRECNQKAYPGDNCCCCCQCSNKVLPFPPWTGTQCNNNNNNNIFNACNTDNKNCKVYNKNNNNNNKWYNADKYCNCKNKNTWNDNNNNNNRNCNGNNDERRKDSDRSLLDFCLEEHGPHTVTDIQDLKECCAFDDKKCDDYFDEVQTCLIDCINPCMLTHAGDWLDCIRDNGEEGKCSRQECLDGFLTDLPVELGLAKDPNVFNLKTIYKMVEKIHEEDLEDCKLLHDFVTDTCNVGNYCCSKCQEDIGLTVDCLLNDIIIPFASIALNTTIDECPIDTEKCKAEFRGRELTKEQLDKFQMILYSPKSSRSSGFHKKPYANTRDYDEDERNLEEDTTSGQESAAECQRQFEVNILAHNQSYAANKFMECIMIKGVEALPDTPPEAAAAASFVVVSLMMTAILISMTLAALV